MLDFLLQKHCEQKIKKAIEEAKAKGMYGTSIYLPGYCWIFIDSDYMIKILKNMKNKYFEKCNVVYSYGNTKCAIAKECDGELSCFWYSEDDVENCYKGVTLFIEWED